MDNGPVDSLLFCIGKANHFFEGLFDDRSSDEGDRFCQWDLFGADRFALADVGAASEQLVAGLRNHGGGPAIALGLALGQGAEVHDFSPRE